MGELLGLGKRIRPARGDDVFSLAVMSQQSDQHGWSESLLASSLEHHLCFVLEGHNTSLVGVAVFQRVLDEAELLYVVIDKASQGQGYGYRFLSSLVSSLGEQGIETFFLEVRESNLPAQGLYQRLGFCQVGLRKNYYPGTESGARENALLYRMNVANFPAGSPQ